MSADNTFRLWRETCEALSGVQNRYTINGVSYIFVKGKGNNDDAITGKVLKVTGSYDEITQAVKVGSFRIERDGEVSKWPAGLRQLVEVAA
jgi:hypothetical protein